jgi:replicative DNA helicase
MSYEKIQSLEAEQWVLGSILNEPDTILIVSDIITPNDFYSKKNQAIYSCCLELWVDGLLNIINLHERLKEKGILDEYGGVDYISYLSLIPTSANIKHYANIVKKYSILRGLYILGNNLISTIDNTSDVKEVITKTEDELIHLSQRLLSQSSVSAQEIIKDIYNEWDNKTPTAKIPTPNWLSCDYIGNNPIPLLMPGHIWVVGGYTSVGKSTWLAQVVSDLCKDGKSILMFSLEDSRKEKIIKLISNLANVSQKKLLIGEIKEHTEQINKAVSLINSWKLFVYDSSYDIEDIRLKIKKHKIQDNIQIVCIDFIQNLLGHGSIYEKMSNAITHLQKIAKEFKITLIVLSQVSNEAMKTESEVIGLKGAGELAATADIVLWLKRSKNDEHYLDCEIKKNRPFGITGIIPLQFSEYWTRIERRK